MVGKIASSSTLPAADTTSAPAGGAPAKKQRRGGRKPISRKQLWFRRACLVVLTLIFVICTIPFTPIPRWVVTPIVSRYLNTPASIETVDMGLRSLVIKDLKLRVENVSGEASEFLSVGEVHMTVDWWKLVRGTGGMETVTLTSPVVRVSQSSQDGSLNISQIEIPQSSRPSVRLPNVSIHEAVLELGEHQGATYRPLKKLVVGGGLFPTAGNERSYIFTLKELGTSGPDAGVHLQGKIDNNGLDVTLTGIRISEWTDENLPGRVRAFVDSLELTGGIKRADFSYHNNVAIGPIIELENVAMTLPVPPEEGTGENLRMTSVNGTMTFANDRILAQVSGKVGDLPYNVDLEYMGFAEDSAFRCVLDCRDFQLQSNPDLLPYVPDLARMNLSRFSKPTAIVDASVVISRGPPTPQGPAPVRSSGWLEFEHGSAAYQGFPYRFYDLSGRVTFDDTRIDLERISGVSQSGAVLNASGWIAPLNADPAAEIHVRAERLPIDDELRKTLDARWRTALERVMDPHEFARFVDLGLLRQADDSHQPGDTIDGVPVFSLGGVANVDLVVLHDGGEHNQWEYVGDVQFDRVGLIAGEMPLPIVGHDVNLRVTPGAVGILNGTWATAAGTPIDLSATMWQLPGEDTPYTSVRVKSKAVTIDGLLVASLPHPLGSHTRAPTPDGQIDGQTEALIDALGINGTIGVVAHFTARNNERELRAEVVLNACRLQPKDSTSIADRISGTAIYENGRVTLDCVSSVCNTDDETTRSPLALHATLTPIGDDTLALPDGDTDTMVLDAFVESSEFDMSVRVEDLIRPLAPQAMEALARWRGTQLPAGVSRIRTHVHGPTDSPKAVLELDQIESLAITLDGSRLGIGPGSGRIDVTIDPGAARDEQSDRSSPDNHGAQNDAPYVLAFSDLRGLVHIDDARIGDVSLDGNWPVAPATPTSQAQSLALTLDNGALDAEANPAIVRLLQSNGMVSNGLAKTVAGLDLAGVYRLVMRMDAVLDRRSAGGAPERTTHIALRAEPKKLAATLDNYRYTLDSVGGTLTASISIADHENAQPTTTIAGWLEHVSMQTGAWTIGANGPWSVREDGWVVSTEIDLALREIDESVLATVPADTRALLRDATIEMDKPITIDGARLTLGSVDGEPITIALEGVGSFDIRDAKIGERVRDAAGTVAFAIENDSSTRGTNFTADVEASGATIGGMQMRDLHVSIERDAEERITRIPALTAAVHGGRVVGSVSVIDPVLDGQHPSYLATIQLSGVDLNHLTKDLARKADEAIEDEQVPDYSGASLSGEVRLSGVLGEPETRRGRGSARAAGGTIVSVPLLLPIIEMLNLQLPSAESLDLAQATFYIEGSVVSFEQLGIYSRSIVMPGFGTLDWETRSLDLRLFSRGARTIPILGHIYEALRNELVSARITGTVSDPKFALETLRGSRNSIGRAMGTRDASQTERALLRDATVNSPSVSGSGVLRPVKERTSANGDS